MYRSHIRTYRRSADFQSMAASRNCHVAQGVREENLEQLPHRVEVSHKWGKIRCIGLLDPIGLQKGRLAGRQDGIKDVVDGMPMDSNSLCSQDKFLPQLDRFR